MSTVDRKEDRFSSGEKLREVESGFRRAHGGDGLGLSATRRDSQQALGNGLTHKDAVVFTPARTAEVGGITERDRRAAIDGDLVQFTARGESDPKAIGREEWFGRALGSSELGGGALIQPAQEQSRWRAGDVRQPCSIGGDCDLATSGGGHGQRNIRAQIHVEPDERTIHRFFAPPGRPQSHDREGGHHCRHDPGPFPGRRDFCRRNDGRFRLVVCALKRDARLADIPQPQTGIFVQATLDQAADGGRRRCRQTVEIRFFLDG